jgi:hypothetical protein
MMMMIIMTDDEILSWQIAETMTVTPKLLR